MYRSYTPDENYMDDILGIEECYGRRLSKAEYNYVNEERKDLGDLGSAFLTECAVGLMTHEAVADHLRQVFGSNSLPTKSSSTDSGLNRSLVNSQLIAINAKGREEVVGFRKVVMKNKLITTDKIEGWIRRNAKKDGKATPPNDLKYWLPEQDRATSVYVAPGGLLDRLRVLSIRLSVAFGWTQAQSTTWVLTEVFPIIEAIEVGAEIYSEEVVSNKVTLKIDPTSTHDEVVEAYRWARDHFFQGRDTRNTTKSELLALIYKLHEGKGRKEKLQIWNELCSSGSEGWEPSWSYDPVGGINNFQRDLKHAYNNYMQGRHVKGDHND